jgi:hypothetical protein
MVWFQRNQQKAVRSVDAQGELLRKPARLAARL